MKKFLSYIELTFENIDYIIIPAQYVTDIRIGDITTCRCNTAESVELTLNKEVNDAAKTFTGDVYVMQSEGASLFERISKYRDITHVRMIYEDDTFEEYTLAREEDSTGFRNLLQKTSIIENGDMKVTIKQ